MGRNAKYILICIELLFRFDSQELTGCFVSSPEPEPGEGGPGDQVIDPFESHQEMHQSIAAENDPHTDSVFDRIIDVLIVRFD